MNWTNVWLWKKNILKFWIEDSLGILFSNMWHFLYIFQKPHPYQFGYKIKDDYGNEQSREEAGDAYGVVKGTYGLIDKHGIYRQVVYTADDYGFKAYIKTNEPGTANQDPADVHIDADPVILQYEATHKGYGKGPPPAYGKPSTGYGKPSTGHGYPKTKEVKGYAHAKGTSYGAEPVYRAEVPSGYQTPKYPSQYY